MSGSGCRLLPMETTKNCWIYIYLFRREGQLSTSVYSEDEDLSVLGLFATDINKGNDE